MNKILSDTKELLGVPSDVTVFDKQLIMHINAAFVALNQLGIGPETGYVTTTDTGDLDEFLPLEEEIHSLIQMYLYAKVRLVFDPPTSSITLGALEKAVSEYEWRLTNHISVTGE